MFTTRLPGPPALPLRRAFLTNATVLACATLALAVTPATVSFPIAVTEAVVLVAGAAAAMVLNLLLLPRGGKPARGAGEPEHAVAAIPVAISDRARPPRLLVCWDAPQHLSEAEAEEWASTELRSVLHSERIGAAQLSRLHSASPRYSGVGDWLLELDVALAPAARIRFEGRAWDEWLDDLSLLGLHPAAVIADPARLLTPRED